VSHSPQAEQGVGRRERGGSEEGLTAIKDGMEDGIDII
jgi:hypothetical protein